jgi:seryl-tRNA synthetase
MNNQYSSEYPEIVIDQTTNSPNSNMSIRLTVEQYHDLLHHTHKVVDLVGNDKVASTEDVAELKESSTKLSESISTLESKLEELSNKLNTYIENDIGVLDYDATKPGIQDEDGNTVEE